MKIVHLLSFIGVVAASPAGLFADPPPKKPVLEEVASFPTQEVTGIGVSKTGRIFVNFPFWDDKHGVSVAELLPGGVLKPYPDEEWNRPDGNLADRWVCVQSVVVDDTDSLWVLDPASPKMEGVVAGGPKLVKIDLATNRVVQNIPFSEKEAPKKSYLNDVRIDSKFGHAFLTDSGLGALLTVDLRTGKIRRLLEDNPSTKAEPGVELIVDGIKLIDSKTGGTPQMHSDGIALDLISGTLYFHPLTGHSLYRVKTADLLNEQLSGKQLGEKVEKLGTTPAPDGMLEAPDGSVYLATFETDSISRWNTHDNKLENVIQDKRLQWPDTMAWGPDGSLYVTTSQIHRMPQFNKGVSKQEEPFRVYRLKNP